MSSNPLGRAWLWATEKPRVQRWVTRGRFTKPVVDRFIAGNELADALTVIERMNQRGIGGILDLLGEGVEDPAGARAATEEYLKAIHEIGSTGIDTTVSLKLSQLGLAFDKGACVDHLRRLATEAKDAGAQLEIDMEQFDFVENTIDVYRLIQVDFPQPRLALQAYLRRTPADLEALADIRPRIRLVKGAYFEPEDVAFHRAAEIDAQYRYLTDWLFAKGTDPAIATHDGRLLEHARRAAERTGAGKEGFEIQMLYGVRRELQERLAADGYRVRVYVPYGSAWYPYLMRRIAERPGNLRFFLRALARG